MFAFTEKKSTYFVYCFVLFCLGFQIWILDFSHHRPSSLGSSPSFFTHLLVQGVKKNLHHQTTRGGLWEVGVQANLRWKVSDGDMALLRQEIRQVLKENKEEEP